MSDMKQMTRQGREIETGSFAIIDREIEEIYGGHRFSLQEWPIVRRAIHTTGDFEYAELFQFSSYAVKTGIAALKSGAPIVSDVSMIISGLNQNRLAHFSNQAHCFIRDNEVIRQAKAHQETRTIWAMRRARDLGLLDGAIVGIGNGPTALIEVLRMVKEQEVKPALIIGIPVGFVMAKESKDMLFSQPDVAFITSLGRKGGSPIVVSTIHALLALAVN